MKKLLLVLVLVFATGSFGLSKISAIPTEEKLLLDKVFDNLNFNDVSDESRNLVYEQLKPFLKSGWYSHWLSNTSGADSKLDKAETAFADIMIYNNERVTNITLIYFRKFNQMYINTKEFIETTSDLGMGTFRKNQKDKQFENLNETDYYAVFNKKGFMGYETVHIKEPNAMMVYETANYLDVFPTEADDKKGPVEDEPKDDLKGSLDSAKLPGE